MSFNVGAKPFVPKGDASDLSKTGRNVEAKPWSPGATSLGSVPPQAPMVPGQGGWSQPQQQQQQQGFRPQTGYIQQPPPPAVPFGGPHQQYPQQHHQHHYGGHVQSQYNHQQQHYHHQQHHQYSSLPPAPQHQGQLPPPATAPPQQQQPPPPPGPPLSPTNPIVALVLGVRGSGKSTQAKRLAERYNLLHVSSGDLARQALDPLVELDELLKTHFPVDGERNLNGLALDRFVATSAMDVYYLAFVLEKYRLKLNVVFHLAVHADVGIERAQQRDGESKPTRDQRRLQEQQLLRDVNKTLFSATGVLHDIGDGDVDTVFQEICKGMATTLMRQTRPSVVLPRQTLEDGTPMVTDYFLYKTIKYAIHDTLETPKLKYETFPGSQIVGQMTKGNWERHFKLLPSYYVTLKADGKRMILVRWQDRLFAFPGKFTCTYEIPKTSIPLAFFREVEQHSDFGIYFILDSELSIHLPSKKYSFFIFDFIYFAGLRATRIKFSERYATVKKLVDSIAGFTTMYLKEFVPLNQLPKLLPSMDAPDLPFHIDGIVFQHDNVYRVPQDKGVFKWKPVEMCSIDFRLCHPQKVEEDGEGHSIWEFDLAVLSVTESGTKDEKPYPGAYLRVTNDEIAKLGLAAGVIVEAVQTRKPTAVQKFHQHRRGHGASPPPEGASARHQWKVLRIRTDKLFPNAEEIANFIHTMEPWSFEEVKKACSGIRSTAPTFS